MIDKKTEVNGYVETLQDIGKEGMTDFQAWHSTYIADKKTMIVSLTKRDMIDVLSNARTIETANR